MLPSYRLKVSRFELGGSLQLHQKRAERGNLERLAAGSRFGMPMAHPEQAAILGLWRSACHHPANSQITAAGGVRLITHGWAGWLRYADDGGRLIFLFLMPGDFIVPGLFEPGCCDLVSLTPMRTVDASVLHGDDKTDTPRSATLIADSGRYYRLLLIDHLTRLTNGCTTRSVAHLLAEFHSRSMRAGTGNETRFSLPIGQRILARALGRSTVQVNKVINQLQVRGILKVGFDWVEVHDPAALKALAGLTHVGAESARASTALMPPEG